MKDRTLPIPLDARRRATRRAALATALALVLLTGGSALAGHDDVGEKWQAQGPAPNTEGQTENVTPDNQVVGAVHVVVAHPTSPSTLYVGSVNGGVWKTTNATSNNIKWKPLTDDLGSPSIGALDMDPSVPSHKTLVAGIGGFSSLGRLRGAAIGLLRTTNGGESWTVINGGGTLLGKNISGVAARGNTLVVSVNTADAFTFPNIGIFRSADGGATFTQISVGNGAGTGLPGGVANDLVGDPLNPSRLFTSILFANSLGGLNGVYRSDDTGATWTKVSSPAMDALLISGVTSNVEFAVGRHNNVYAAIANSGRLAGVFRSGDGGATWTAMDLPLTNEGSLIGIHPGGQASIHLSIVADPTDAHIVYIGGDRQPLFNEVANPPLSDFPNSIGAVDFSGRLFRGNASSPAGSQWVHLTHSSSLGAPGGGTASSSSPHADSREMTFDAHGRLIETDDGGIFRRSNPRDNTGDWTSLNGNLQVGEFHATTSDELSNIVFGGTQDIGTDVQDLPFDLEWSTLLGGDGSDTAVDDVSNPAFSTRFSSAQFLQAFNRTFWDAANNFLGFDFPTRTPIGGSPAMVAQFYTPVRINNVDKNRLIFGANNGVYESQDQGFTVLRIGAGIVVTGNPSDPIGYGATGNPDILYLGTTDDVWVRTAAHPAPLVLSATFPGNGTGRAVRDIAIDPDNGNQAFAMNLGGVYRTQDAGATWTDVTGNLLTFPITTPRSLALARTSEGDAIVVGTVGGVYIATADDGFAVWQKLGEDLPNTHVFELEYDASTDTLVAGTIGRATWKQKKLSETIEEINNDD
ncbi:MAG TPA: RTX toxin [Thermoanaerobaculia bacterium]|nr:RTX toxin [Thermoanaerobaculia bacterium]